MKAQSGSSATTGIAQYGMRLRRIAAWTYSGGGFGGGATTAGAAAARAGAGVAAGAGSTSVEGVAAAAGGGGVAPPASAGDNPNCSRRSRERLSKCSGISVTAPSVGDESAVTLGGTQGHSGTGAAPALA